MTTPMTQMERIATLGRFIVYWANRRDFLKPGVLVWTGSRHRRLLPLPRTRRKVLHELA